MPSETWASKVGKWLGDKLPRQEGTPVDVSAEAEGMPDHKVKDLTPVQPARPQTIIVRGGSNGGDASRDTGSTANVSKTVTPVEQRQDGPKPPQTIIVGSGPDEHPTANVTRVDGPIPTGSSINNPMKPAVDAGSKIGNAIRAKYGDPSTWVSKKTGDSIRAFGNKLSETADISAVQQRESAMGRAFQKSGYMNGHAAPDGVPFSDEENAYAASVGQMALPRDISSFSRDDSQGKPTKTYTEEDVLRVKRAIANAKKR